MTEWLREVEECRRLDIPFVEVPVNEMEAMVNRIKELVDAMHGVVINLDDNSASGAYEAWKVAKFALGEKIS